MSNDRTPFPQSRRLVKPDGTVAMTWDNKLHNWEGPALITPEGKKEYYLYGKKMTLEQWEEARKNREGLPWYKNASMKGATRF